MSPFQPYEDRTEGGRALGRHLRHYANRPDTVVLGLPRGGVPVALEVARALRAPLDVFVVRKLGLPTHPELAMGAIASGGAKVLNDDVIRAGRIEPAELEAVISREAAELRRREAAYRGARPPPHLERKTVIVVDDGVATGASLRAAILALSAHRPARVVVGVPVGAPDTVATLASAVDELVCPLRPAHFHAVGLWYRHFEQVDDEAVRRCLEEAEKFS